jgi:hypothetical protein
VLETGQGDNGHEAKPTEAINHVDLANPKIGAQPRMRQRPAERQQSRVIDNRWSGGGFDGDFVAEGFELVDVGAFAAFGVDALGVEV